MTAFNAPSKRTLTQLLIAIAVIAVGAVVAVVMARPSDARSAAPNALPPPVFSVIGPGRPAVDLGAFEFALDLQPGTARLAFSDASGTYALARNRSGEVCLVFTAANGPGFAACDTPENLRASGAMVSHVDGQGMEARTIGLVPDGVATVDLPNGRAGQVRDNVFSVANDGTPPPDVVLRGPGGPWTLRSAPRVE